MAEQEAVYLAILVPVAVAVISASIIGAWKWTVSSYEDSVKLKADLSMPGDLEIMGYIGCACIVVAVKCTGKRQAKISGAVLALENVDFVPLFEQAFGASFGIVQAKAGPPPAYTIELVPLKERTVAEGFILERDDVVRFALPIRVFAIDKFPDAPSQDVWIAVRFFDNNERILLRGLRIQHMIADLIASWGDKRQTLNVDLEFGLRHSSAVLPDTSHLVGKTNPNPLRMPAPTDEQQSSAEAIGTGSIRVVLPLYSLVSPDHRTTVISETELGLLIPLFSSIEIAQEHMRASAIPVAIREFATLDQLHGFLARPPGSVFGPLPNLRILYDSVDRHRRQVGLLDHGHFVNTLKSQLEAEAC